MTQREFDKVLAFHCAPALAGIKAANLISIRKQDCDDALIYIETYHKVLCQYGISFDVLYDCETHILVLIYREAMLWRNLQRPEVIAFLREQGYIHWASVTTVLNTLKAHCRSGTFPHEIGLFLDYPLDDVVGFIRHGGKDYKVCGYWKVYSDAASAMRQFEMFTLCRNDFCRRLKRGSSIFDFFRVPLQTVSNEISS